MLQDFRQEKWYTIFTELLTKTIQSAILSASVNDFITSSVEALSPNIKITTADRQNILENLWKVFNNSAPTFQNQIATEIVQCWKESLANCRSPIIVNLDDIPKLIDCKFSFKSNQVKFTEPIIISIYIRSNAKVPLKIAKITAVLLTNNGSKHRLEAKNGYIFEVDSSTKNEKLDELFDAHNFILEKEKCFKFELETKPGQFVENSEITVQLVELSMGTEKISATLTMQKSLNTSKYFQTYNIHSDYLEFIKIVRTCYVIPSFHLQSNVIHNQPMLLNEYYKIQVNLKNNSDELLQNLNIKILLPANYKNKVFLTKDSSESITKMNSCISFNIEGNIELKQSLCYENIDTSESNTIPSPLTEKELSPSTETLPTVFAASEEEHLDIQVERLENNLVRKRHDDILIVPCVEEFSFDCRFYTLDRKPLETCYANEEFLMRLLLKTKSPFNIDILDAFFIADPNISEKSNHNGSFIKNDISRECNMENVFTLIPKNTTAEWITKEKLNKSASSDVSLLFAKQKVIETEASVKINPEVAHAKDEDDPFSLKKKDQKTLDYSTINIEKETLNVTNSLDIIKLMADSNHKKGFINGKINVLQDKNMIDLNKKFGLYCIRWRKSNTDNAKINESKFLIEGLDVVKPLLNIYCTSTNNQRVFVREVFTYKILFRNPNDEILHFTATIGNSDGFMFSGHKQLTFTIFAHSEFELALNLYPLKSNFQRLPELKLEIKSYSEDIVAIVEKDGNVVESGSEISRKQTELNELLERWLPKSIFVHPPNRKVVV
ncbi:hypothetical protein PVAND_004344 [Polypedilum vanderplanki]|uniref:Trafficking protein particle complex subunit 11 C-terminal domain-containing protein n=1 Tax=Polypedilum vanderplanki TaxID=319348 RepID=A0A9J6BXA2_POLVA|nr:hypothetical protein PVAND_004344 [Polypedilum vanderplanki]